MNLKTINYKMNLKKLFITVCYTIKEMNTTVQIKLSASDTLIVFDTGNMYGYVWVCIEN